MSSDRKSDISNFLFIRGETPVQELAKEFGISFATIRRDLTEMERAGLVERSHGTARIATSARDEVGFEVRENANLGAKRALATAVYPTIRPRSTIFLDAGTTVLQLARRIKLMRIPVTVFTNGLVVAQELSDVPEVTLCLLGGRLRAENMSVVGPLANAMLEGLWFDQLFLGASAISDDGWITSYDADEARVNAKMVSRAHEVNLLVDHSKLGQRATYAVFQLSGDEKLVTDRPLPALLERHANDVGLHVTIAGEQGTSDVEASTKMDSSVG